MNKDIAFRGKLSRIYGAPLMNTKDIAAYLQVHRSWVYSKVKNEEIPFLRVGRTLWFDPNKVIEKLETVQQKSNCSDRNPETPVS